MNYQTYLKVSNYTIVILMHLAVVLVVVSTAVAIAGIGMLVYGASSAVGVLIGSLIGLVIAIFSAAIGIVLSAATVEQL